MRSRAVLMVALLALPIRANASDVMVLETSVGKVPSGANLGTPALRLDGVVRGILPSKLRISLPSTVKVSVSGGDLGFNAVLKRANAGFAIEQRPNTHCTPYDAVWSIRESERQLTVTLEVKKVGEWMCEQYPAIGMPDGKGKLRFESSPSGATLYYPKYFGSDFIVKPTPATLVVDFTTNHDISVVFKKAGYYDCSRTLGFKREAGTFSVSVDGVMAGPTTTNTATAPRIECSLTSASTEE